MKRIALLAAVALLVACDDTNVHLLYGQQFDTQYGCMLPEQGIDVVNGPDPGQSCSPVCLDAQLDGEDLVYITTTCPPYDPYPTEKQGATHGSTDPCTAAFAAYTGNVECGPDGGPPDGGLDASKDAQGAPDATLDGPSDAPAEAAPEAGVDANEAAPGPNDAGADTDEASAEAGPDALSD